MNLKARWVFFEEVFTCRWVRRKSVQKGAGSKRLDREEHRLMKVNWSISWHWTFFKKTDRLPHERDDSRMEEALEQLQNRVVSVFSAFHEMELEEEQVARRQRTLAEKFFNMWRKMTIGKGGRIVCPSLRWVKPSFEWTIIIQSCCYISLVFCTLMACHICFKISRMSYRIVFQWQISFPRRGEGLRSELKNFCETETKILLFACTQTLAQFT